MWGGIIFTVREEECRCSSGSNIPMDGADRSNLVSYLTEQPSTEGGHIFPSSPSV